MTQAPDLKYFFTLDDEDRFPLSESVTIGRHLENDLVVAGEDVLDFHLRVELTDRGPAVHPLGEATLTLNGEDHAQPMVLIAGDHLLVGQTGIELCAQAEVPSEVEAWWLYADGENAAYEVCRQLNVGRAEDNEIMLMDDHVSRYHAQFRLNAGAVWLKDLGSANGTFVNGQRVSGGMRLYHGDAITFDLLSFQLVGKGEGITDVRRQAVAEEQAPIKLDPDNYADTTEVAAVDDDLAPLEVPESAQTGAFLLGASEPVSGMTFRTRIGRTVVGRSEDCDLVIADQTVSTRHAEIVVRPESCTVTNLMATNGTCVNGVQIQSAELKDGDLLRIGRVHLVYKDVPAAESERLWLRRTQWILLGASGLLALGLFWLLL